MSADDTKPKENEPVQDEAVESAADIAAEAAESPAGTAEESAEVSSEDVSVEELVTQLQEAQAEVERLKDVAMRTEADAQNVRRRAEKDVEAAHKYGQEKLLQELLAVKDNLERALAAGADIEDGPAKAVLEGVELTDKSFTDLLTKSSVEAVNPEGEPFDPQLHQAMSMVPSPEVPANTVMTVVQKGYTLNGRLLRPAMVMVSQGGGDNDATGGNVDAKA